MTMGRKLRRILATLIAILPFNICRILAYKYILRYQIGNALIGFGTVISVDNALIENCYIGSLNEFRGPISIVIKDNVRIGVRNRFIGGSWMDEFKDSFYDRHLVIEKNAFITNENFFDISGRLELGERSWIAGLGSQFWTHGAGVTERNIKIGHDCYIGSSVRFCPGVEIGNNVLVGIGSVVTKKFSDDFVALGGAPAEIIKVNFDWTKRMKQSWERGALKNASEPNHS